MFHKHFSFIWVTGYFIFTWKSGNFMFKGGKIHWWKESILIDWIWRRHILTFQIWTTLCCIVYCELQKLFILLCLAPNHSSPTIALTWWYICLSVIFSINRPQTVNLKHFSCPSSAIIVCFNCLLYLPFPHKVVLVFSTQFCCSNYIIIFLLVNSSNSKLCNWWLFTFKVNIT